MPDVYHRFVDPLIALTAAAVAAPSLRLGTCVLLVAQRDPIVTAKALATLDLISGGRLSIGVGYGWNAEEMQDHGVSFATRRDQAREHVLAMRRLWSDDVAAFNGDFVRLQPSWCWPKPIQSGGPQILIGGGAGPGLFRNIAEYGDGWLPIHSPDLPASVDRLRREFERVGRDPDSLVVTTVGTTYDNDALDALEAIGVMEHLWSIQSGGVDEVLPQIDRVAAVIQSRLV